MYVSKNTTEKRRKLSRCVMRKELKHILKSVRFNVTRENNERGTKNYT